jgi:hypothetical protein
MIIIEKFLRISGIYEEIECYTLCWKYYRRFQNGVGWYIWIKKKIPDYRTITGRLQDENRTKPGRILVFEYIITNQCPTLF